MMFKKSLYLLVPLLLTISCSGLLWEGYGSDDLTIAIDNPFYRPGQPDSSRALAMQGKFLYIELALIENLTAYEADTAKSTNTEGIWVETAWGGHAVVTATISDVTEIIEKKFIDVPRDRNLQARVILETDEETFNIEFPYYDYGEIFPVCNTYDPSNPVPQDRVWVTVTSEELKQNILLLPIRPISPFSIAWDTNTSISEDFASTPMHVNPQQSATVFYSLDPVLSLLEIRDVAYYCLVSSTVALDNTPPTILAYMYDKSGKSLDPPTVSYTDNAPASPDYSYRSLQMHVENLPDYSDPGLFFGITSFSAIPTATSWNLRCGFIYDQSLSAGPFNTEFEASWAIPQGFTETDLEFKMVYINNTILPTSNLDTVSNVLSQTITREWAWNEVPWNSGMSKFYYSETGYNVTIDAWLVVLARFPGGEPFIYGKTRMIDLLLS